MNLQPIIDRLKADVPDLITVGGAAEMDAAITSGSPRTPAAYVIEESCQATPDSRAWSLTVESVVSVYLIVRLSGDTRGHQSAVAMHELRQQVVAALHGYTPENNIHEILYRGGALADFQPGTLWWSERFSVQHIVN